MKWQLVTLGLGWGYFLFKLYQQFSIRPYRQHRLCRSMYYNQNIISEENQIKNSQQTVEYDSENKQKLISPQLIEQITPNSATQMLKKEGKNDTLKSEKNKKLEFTLDTTIDECQFVVFPQMYPHLRKKKHLSKKLSMNKSANQKNRLNLKRKRQTKKQSYFYIARFKQWFITNKILSQIQESGQLSAEQIEANYTKLTKEIKSTCIEGNKSNSDSAKSQEGTTIGNGQIVIKAGNGKEKAIGNKILGFLEDQFINEQINKRQIHQYDPFQ